MTRRLFAVIPAAGQSRRMGRPKLLLPFGETTVIGRLLTTLTAEEIATYVLIRPDDTALKAEVCRTPAIVVQPTHHPREMRVSVEHLLQSIEESHHPDPDDGWLLIPADHPLLSVETLRKIVATWHEHPAAIVVPSLAEQRGHPTLFPWSLAAAVNDLPPDVGINQLVRDDINTVLEVPVDDPTLTLDLDTPDDYTRALSLIDAE